MHVRMTSNQLVCLYLTTGSNQSQIGSKLRQLLQLYSPHCFSRGKLKLRLSVNKLKPQYNFFPKNCLVSLSGYGRLATTMNQWTCKGGSSMGISHVRIIKQIISSKVIGSH
jgi:hypothetical protein